jgi:hypothetical protein
MPTRHRHRHSSERGKSITITMGSCSRSVGIRVHDALEIVNTMRRNMHLTGDDDRRRCIGTLNRGLLSDGVQAINA